MQRIIDFLNAHYDALCILLGGFAGFIVTMLRNRDTSKSWGSKIADAALCACISSALCQAGIYLFDMTPNLSIFCGTFCGWLGTDYLKGLITGYIESKIKRKSQNEDE